MTQQPTLDGLFLTLKQDHLYRAEMIQLYRNVASGKRHPTEPSLPENVIILACQAMTILFEHVEETHR